MPLENNFLHAKYSRTDPGERVKYVTFQSGAPPHSPPWSDALGRLGAALCQAGVRIVVLIYGSHLGADLFGSGRLDEVGGLKRGYSRGIPGLESLLALLRPGDFQKPPVQSTLFPPYSNDPHTRDQLDAIVGDTGNFTAEYSQALQDGLSIHGQLPLTCTRILWSSVNHHVGRLEAALSLFREIQALRSEFSLNPDDRILILGHGHAGQILALLSNLIAPGDTTVRPFLFEILESFVQGKRLSTEFGTHLQELTTYLSQAQPDLPSLDLVTLGTPIRYGWDLGGIGKLLHLVNHRPIRGDSKRWLAKMDLPQVVMEMQSAIGGDYVQQIAVAGTDAIPGTPELEELNQSLRENLEPYDGFERWLECTRRVSRCPNDGQCVLIDYQDAASVPPEEHLYGHACYTRMGSLLFQTTQIVEALYPPPSL